MGPELRDSGTCRPMLARARLEPQLYRGVLILRQLTGILGCFLGRGLESRADFRTGREEHHTPAP